MRLIIAEKNIAARRIADILSGSEKPGKGTPVRTGKENGVNTYRFEDTVTLGLRGHVVEIDFEPGYSNWRSEVNTPRTLIDAGTIKKPTEKNIVSLIKKLSKKATLVTIATDFDREGELIGKEAFEIVRAANKDVPVQRARFSAITPHEISTAFQDPAEIDFDLAAAGEARQIIDLIWGASLTRFISIAAKRGGKSILSVGRVQSPTLAMIVDREKEIEAFVPKPYWMLSVDTEKDGTPVTARHTTDRFHTKSEAVKAEQNTSAPLVVTSVKEGTRVDRAPAPFDTTSFIVAAGRLHFSAANAMRIAEDLYMNGYVSYPRTDNTIYPKSLDVEDILQQLRKSPLSRAVEWTQAHRRKEPTRGKKSSTDHPPIHPAGAAKKETLTDDQWKIYELIVRRFLATLSPDARWTTLKYLFDAGAETYTATGSRLAEAGYREVYTYSEAKETILPVMNEGDRLPILAVNNEEKFTTPPPRYSQSKLIQRMEELGLGTKSTRHEVIGKLISRRYVEGTPVRPTLVGRGVVEAMENHGVPITNPEMTSTIEQHMEEIKEANLSRDEVISESKTMLRRVFDALEANEEQIGREIMDRNDEERIIGKCPVCEHDLMIRQTRGMSQFIGCTGYPECTFNIGLPSAAWGTAIREDKTCESYGLNFVRLIRKGARPWEIGCPLCNHINSNSEAFRMMPSADEKMVARLHAAHIYSVYEVANVEPERLTTALATDVATVSRLREEANAVLEILRKRSELKKFVRKHVVPRRGRSPAKVAAALVEAGVSDLEGLAAMTPDALTKMHLSAAEAETLLNETRAVYNRAKLREYGVPAVSLKKYFEAGITTPADFCSLHPAYLSVVTGIKPETVWKHATSVCTGMGVAPPEKVTARMVEAGRNDLLQIPGLGEMMLERLYRAGVIDMAGLKDADAGHLAEVTGVTLEKIRAFQDACRENK
jgi:DNA topoisomerase I